MFFESDKCMTSWFFKPLENGLRIVRVPFSALGYVLVLMVALAIVSWLEFARE